MIKITREPVEGTICVKCEDGTVDIIWMGECGMHGRVSLDVQQTSDLIEVLKEERAMAKHYNDFLDLRTKEYHRLEEKYNKLDPKPAPFLHEYITLQHTKQEGRLNPYSSFEDYLEMVNRKQEKPENEDKAEDKDKDIGEQS